MERQSWWIPSEIGSEIRKKAAEQALPSAIPDVNPIEVDEQALRSAIPELNKVMRELYDSILDDIKELNKAFAMPKVGEPTWTKLLRNLTERLAWVRDPWSLSEDYQDNPENKDFKIFVDLLTYALHYEESFEKPKVKELIGQLIELSKSTPNALSMAEANKREIRE